MVATWTPTVMPSKVRLELVDQRLLVGVDLVEVGAVELARVARELAVLEHRELGRRRGVAVGELDHLLALVGDRHAGHDDVVLAGLQRRDDAFPVLRHDLALGAHAPAQVVGEVDLEADQLARAVGRVPRRVGALGRDPDGGPFLGRGAAGDQAEAQRHDAAASPTQVSTW